MQEPIPSSFGHATTAADVLRGRDLAGTIAIVTGAAGGIGKETARALAKAGVEVILAGRTPARLEAARQEIAAQTAVPVHARVLDLMTEKSIDGFADAVLDMNRPLDILINNAGVFGPLLRNEQGIESLLMTNFLGHALLTSRLVPALLRAKSPRIVSLSSVGHHFSSILFDDPNFERKPLGVWFRYGQSKTACSLLAVKVASALARKGLTAHAVHPGAIATDLGRTATAEDFAEFVTLTGSSFKQESFKTLEGGAATSVWAATEAKLANKPPLYLEDCGVAPLIDKPNYAYGVLSFALDPELAERTWTLAERLLGRRLPLDA